MDDNVQPFGPSAPIRDLHVGNTRFEQHVEKAYRDTDLRATDAVLDLYDRGVIVSKIQKPSVSARLAWRKTVGLCLHAGASQQWMTSYPKTLPNK